MEVSCLLEYLNMLFKGDDLDFIEDYFTVNDKILQLVHLPETV